jgi:hypothetical protein
MFVPSVIAFALSFPLVVFEVGALLQLWGLL